jgi:alanyl-tRNA synthetase
MTERLYYADAYQTRFSAHVVERLKWEGQPAVVLDRTAFYPTGGGQPHDAGMLDGVPVVDVVEREANGVVLHVLGGPLAADEVEGEVDWSRRFDLMQQHTGQHILSAAFVEALAANTVSFHLSAEYSTIDLDRAPLSVDELNAVETLANAVVFENRLVTARWVPDEQVASLPLRKPLAHKGPVRVVEVPGFDCSACGGTHVRAAGEIGLIKLTRTERRGAETRRVAQTRVEFLCGGRALADYRAKNALLLDLAGEFSVGHREVADLVHRQADDLKDARRELRHLRDALLDAEAEALLRGAEAVGRVRVVRACLPGRSADDLKHLAQRVVSQPQTAVLLAAGEAGEKGFFTFARSGDLDLHMGQLIRQACQVIGGGGGGRPEFAQGGGPDGGRVAEALDAAFTFLVDSVNAKA